MKSKKEMTVQGHFHLQHSLPGEILLAQVSAPTPTPSTLGWWQYWCGMSASLSSPVMATVLTADIHAPPCGDESFQMCGSCFHFRKTLWLQACECTQWLWVVYMQWFPFQHFLFFLSFFFFKIKIYLKSQDFKLKLKNLVRQFAWNYEGYFYLLYFFFNSWL